MIAALLVLVSCGPAGPAVAQATEPALVHDAPVVYDASELQRAAFSWDVYPPTACRLRRLLGPAFATYAERGGVYPDEDGEGGFFSHERACPQPGCASASTWIHPDGRIVVALREGAQLDLYTNDASLGARLPSPMQRVVDGAAEDGGPATPRWVVAATLPDPPECSTPELAARTARWRAVEAGTGCDPELSTFEDAWAVTAAKANFFEQPGGAPRKAYVIAGDLVMLSGAADGGHLCARYTPLAGRATVGWMRREDLVEIPHGWDERDAARLPEVPAPPTWLGARAERFGELSIRGVGGGVEVDVERLIAGHVCSVQGPLSAAGARRYRTEGGDGCAATVALFNNGVFLWASTECGGARANCTGGYSR